MVSYEGSANFWMLISLFITDIKLTEKCIERVNNMMQLFHFIFASVSVYL